MNKSLSRHKNLQFLRKISRKISIIIPQYKSGMKRFEKKLRNKISFFVLFYFDLIDKIHRLFKNNEIRI